LAYAEKVEQALKDIHVRVQRDDREEKLGYRMREAVMKKIPIVLVLGNQEKEENSVTLRWYGSEEKETMSLEACIQMIQCKISNRE